VSPSLAVLEAAERHWGARRLPWENQEQHIERSLREHAAWPTNLEYALHNAVAEMVKERAEDTRR
jgi:hypothetical protein